MDDCCAVPTTPAKGEADRLPILEQGGRSLCPTCGRAGRKIERLTVKSLLARPLDVLRPGDYFFCETADCPTVYYHAEGQCFSEADLRERVYQKHPQDDTILVCYCFQHTLGAIRREALGGGGSRIVEAVTAGVQAGQCACEVRNPQGRCCLGNVRAAARRDA